MEISFSKSLGLFLLSTRILYRITFGPTSIHYLILVVIRSWQHICRSISEQFPTLCKMTNQKIPTTRLWRPLETAVHSHGWTSSSKNCSKLFNPFFERNLSFKLLALSGCSGWAGWLPCGHYCRPCPTVACKLNRDFLTVIRSTRQSLKCTQ